MTDEEYMNIVFINEKVNELKKLQSAIGENNVTAESLSAANELAETLIQITKDTYDRQSEKYAEVRSLDLLDFDQKVWSKLLSHIDKYLTDDYKKLKLLDVATGHGRDLKHAFELGFDVFGVDNSDGFVQGLKKLEDGNIIPKNCFAKADMRSLPFEDSSFDVVRHQASLLHMPIVGKGYTVDKAIQECYRVLKENGLLYILVKKGDGIQYIDTNEGLGGRIFQFYDESTIKNIVERNGFKTITISKEVEDRKGKIVEWVMVIAQKKIINNI